MSATAARSSNDQRIWLGTPEIVSRNPALSLVVRASISLGVSPLIIADDTVRPFRCGFSTCSKAFTRSDLLNRHALLHESRERPVTPSTSSNAVDLADTPGPLASGTSEVEVDWPPARVEIDPDLASASSSRQPEQSKRKIAEDHAVSTDSTTCDDRGFKRVSRTRIGLGRFAN